MKQISIPTTIQVTMRHSEERFRNMADSAPVLIWVADSQKACTFFNKPWLDFTGRTITQELGNGWAEGVHAEDLDRCLEIYGSAFDARETFQMEYRLRRWDGTYRWVLDKGAPLMEHGEFTGYIGSCMDITESKAAHEADFARQRMETVGALAGGVAHDFNNLLGGILAYTELALAELACKSNPIEEIQKIRDASIRGAEIVRQLMVYAGQESEVLELVDVAAVVADMLELLRVAVPKNVAVETDFSENTLLVRANPTKVRQVAMNLIANASEALAGRGGSIRVNTGRVTVGRGAENADYKSLAAGEYLQLEVSDTGHGMSPEVQARIFDPFFTTKPTGSHGHGLVVVQRIVQSMQGEVRVSSASGQGTTFRIFLPAEERNGRATNIQMPPPAVEAFSFDSATILLVDDEDLLRQAVSKMLRKKGLSVIEVSDGTAALDVLRIQNRQIDLLLLDVTLPGTSSRLLYQEARRLRPGMGIVVTSAKAKERADEWLATDIDHFLRKPFRLGCLLGKIRDLLPS